MRRPLAAAALLFAAAVRLITLTAALPVPVSSGQDGREAAFSGEVTDIVCRKDEQTGGEIRLVYLKDAVPADNLSGISTAGPAWTGTVSAVCLADTGNSFHSETCFNSGTSFPSEINFSFPINYNSPINQNSPILFNFVNSVNFPDNAYTVIPDDTGVSLRLVCRLKEHVPLPKIGSRILCMGKIHEYEPASNPGEFDAAAYYGRNGLAFELRQTDIIDRSPGYSLYGQFLFRLRSRMGERLDRWLPAGEASVARAMLLGEKTGMDRELKEMFRQAGISHILAISGLHVSLLGMGIYRILEKLLGKKPSCVISCLFLFSYLSMTGFSASSLRAGILFFLAMGAKLIGRTCDSITSLALAAALLLAGHPAYADESGFLLSFSAALGAVLVLPAFGRMKGIAGKTVGWDEKRTEKGFRGIPGLLRGASEGLLQGLQASFSISLATLPVLLFSYYEWNPLSVLINVAVVPLMGALLGSILILAATGWFPASLPVRAILWLYEFLCRIGSEGQVLRIRTGCPRAWQLLVFYMGLGLLIIFAHRLHRLCGCLAACALCLIFLLHPGREPQLTMLDVGQGECLYLQTGNGHHYLCDAGSSSRKDTGTWQVFPFLKYQGVNRLELVFVTHCDEDHINGLAQLFEQVCENQLEIGGLVLPSWCPRDEAFEALSLAARQSGIPVYLLKDGTSIQDGKGEFLLLKPVEEDACSRENRNDASLVLRYKEEDFSVLFTGDLETEGEEYLLREKREEIENCRILAVGHHGSSGSTSREFLRCVSPDLALISCGRNNSYGHPSQETLDRLREAYVSVFRTDESGAVEVRPQGRQLAVSGYLDRS